MKLTPKAADALARLRMSDDFREFMNCVGDYGEDMVKKVIGPDGASRDHTAGILFGVTAIIEAANTPPEKLDQIIRSK